MRNKKVFLFGGALVLAVLSGCNGQTSSISIASGQVFDSLSGPLKDFVKENYKDFHTLTEGQQKLSFDFSGGSFGGATLSRWTLRDSPYYFEPTKIDQKTITQGSAVIEYNVLPTQGIHLFDLFVLTMPSSSNYVYALSYGSPFLDSSFFSSILLKEQEIKSIQITTETPIYGGGSEKTTVLHEESEYKREFSEAVARLVAVGSVNPYAPGSTVKTVTVNKTDGTTQSIVGAWPVLSLSGTYILDFNQALRSIFGS